MVSTGLSEAVLGWLLAAAGHTLSTQLRAEPARTAMRRLVAESLQATIVSVAGHLDRHRQAHLCAVLREHDGRLGEMAAGGPAELHAAVSRWVMALDRAELGGPGYLSGLDIDARRLGDELARHLVSGVRRQGRTGGPLAPVAEWWWRDRLSDEVAEIKREVSRRQVPSPATTQRSGGLPGVTSDFVGRHQALATLAARISGHDPAGIVLAIHAVDGMAGVGKTEFALRAAHEHKHRYPDGQFFINLHGYTAGIPPMPVEAALAELLRQAGVPAREVPPDLASRTARWQALLADRRALVLLDNALDTGQVRALLPGAAGCLVLITSRCRLGGLPGARTMSLDVLSQTEAVTLFHRVAGPLGLVTGDSDPGRTNDPGPTAVDRVVGLVGRLPVAVRAAAAQTDPAYPAGELADELADAKARAGLATAAGPLGPGVRAVFETSLQRLEPPHRWAFLMAGVHPGPTIGIPQFAALAGLSLTDTRQTLRRLAERNLLTPAPDRVGHGRYQMHDLLRDFAREQAGSILPTSTCADAIARLTTWYATVVDDLQQIDHDSGMVGVAAAGIALADPAQACAWLDAEQPNLLALAAQASGAEAAQTYYRYGRQFYLLDHHATARSLHHRAADLYRQAGDPAGEGHALTGLGEVALAIGRFRAADAHFRAALASFRMVRDRCGEADALCGWGNVAGVAGDYPAAAERFTAALELCRQAAHPTGEANAVNGLAQVARFEGDLPAAAQRFTAALELCRQVGYQTGTAKALSGLGEVARLMGDRSAASDWFEAAVEVSRATGNRLGEAKALYGLGEMALSMDDASAAYARFCEALELCQWAGSRYEEAGALVGLGQVCDAAGDRGAAAEWYEEALAIYREIGDRQGEAGVRRELGLIAAAAGRHHPQTT